MNHISVMKQALAALCAASRPLNGTVYINPSWEPKDAFTIYEQAIRALQQAIKAGERDWESLTTKNVETIVKMAPDKKWAVYMAEAQLKEVNSDRYF